jgi:hypothetical protein
MLSRFSHKQQQQQQHFLPKVMAPAASFALLSVPWLAKPLCQPNIMPAYCPSSVVYSYQLVVIAFPTAARRTG